MNPLIRSITNKFVLPAARTMQRGYCTSSAQTTISKISTFLKFAFLGFGTGLLGYQLAKSKYAFEKNPLIIKYDREPDYQRGFTFDTVDHSHPSRKYILDKLIHGECLTPPELSKWMFQLQKDIKVFESKMNKLEGADWATVRAEKEADEELLDIILTVFKRFLHVEHS